MDARVGDRVITPRLGKPVEVQALWINALAVAAEFEAEWGDVLSRAERSFADRFWVAETGALADVVDVDHVPGTRDVSCRPNQIFAVGGLPHPLIEGDQAARIVETVERRLLTPFGLRSLAPGEPGFTGRYEGGPSSRDAVYHQGIVWPWLSGAFVDAWRRRHRPRIGDYRRRAAVYTARMPVSGLVARRADPHRANHARGPGP
jgi:predicted glycogen debranching enzyme